MLFTDRDYCKAILLSENMGLSSVEKFFLIRVVCSYGVSGEVLATVDALEERLCLSESVLKRTRNNLIEKEYLTNLPDPVNRGGRPRKCFKITTRCLELLQASVLDEELCNREWVEELLFKDNLSEIRVPDRSGKIRKIRPPVRVLMGILLAHSSDVGLVSDLSHADLKKLISGSSDSLKSQMTLLHSIGFIMSSRSGFTSKKTKLRVKGQYVLNLAWQDIHFSAGPEYVIFNKVNGERITQTKNYKVGDVDKNFEALGSLLENEHGKSEIKLGPAFHDYDENMKRYVFWVILECASYLCRISPQSRKAVSKDPDYILKLMRSFEEKIKAKICPSLIRNANKTGESEIFELVCISVLALAKKALKTIQLVGIEDIHKYRYLLLPSNSDPVSSGFCLCIFPDDKILSELKVTSTVEVGMGVKRIKLCAYQPGIEKIKKNLKSKYGFL